MWNAEETNHLLKFGIPLFDLNAFDSKYIPENIISETLIRQHQLLPLFIRNNQLYIAMADPANQTVLDDIQFQTGLKIYSVAVETEKLTKFITLFLEKKSHLIEDIEDDESPIVNFVQKVLLDAIKKSASDIHFEPHENHYRIRFRQDGILYTAATPPHTLGNRIASRIKIMSELDISERRMPQDGRFRLQSVDFRVSTCPTSHGEKIVVRILDAAVATMGIEQLGYEPFQTELLLKTLKKPQGLILVTGPTGSGKTVSLYTALDILNSPEVNISTVEDPVEIHLPGINQVNINRKTGLTFATVLKTFLRQDPDIIMVGEMRDSETAEIGIKAAQTGHLVLSTLHTNSAAETLTRLVNMGVAPYNIATSVTLVIAQRLIRKLCPLCTQNNLPIGCEHCHQGYKGRTGIYEFLPITSEISEAILHGKSALEIHHLAVQAGMQSLQESALQKVHAGITSLAEIHRVT